MQRNEYTEYTEYTEVDNAIDVPEYCYSDDLKYCYDILKIKHNMEIKSLLKLDAFELSRIQQKSIQYVMKTAFYEESGHKVGIGSVHKNLRVEMSSHLSITYCVFDSRSTVFSVRDYKGRYPISDTVLSEEQYFQLSLIHDPYLLRAMLLYSVLKANSNLESSCEYTQINLAYNSSVLKYIDTLDTLDTLGAEETL